MNTEHPFGWPTSPAAGARRGRWHRSAAKRQKRSILRGPQCASGFFQPRLIQCGSAYRSLATSSPCSRETRRGCGTTFRCQGVVLAGITRQNDTLFLFFRLCQQFRFRPLLVIFVQRVAARNQAVARRGSTVAKGTANGLALQRAARQNIQRHGGVR